MQLMIPHDSVDDCNLRWAGCYGHIVSGKDKSLVHLRRIRDIVDGRAAVELDRYSPEDGMWERDDIVWLTNEEIDLSHPTYGNVDIGSACRYVFRRAGNSYRLGCTDARYTVATPSDQALYSLGRLDSPRFGSVVPRLYNNSYRSPAKAIDMIMSKELVSSGVTADISLGLHPGLAGIGVFRRTKVIGSLNPESGVISLGYRHRYFSDELADLGFSINLLEEADNGKNTR